MALPVLSKAKSRDQVIAIDLGSHAFKAVHLQRKGDRYVLSRYAVQPAPSQEGVIPPNSLGPELGRIVRKLGVRSKQVVLVVGVNDAILRVAEMPLVPVSDMRTMVKLNPKTYLQQDLPGHAFDCFILPTQSVGVGSGTRSAQKCRVLVGAMREGLIQELQAAAREAGLTVEAIVPGIIGPANAFELARPDSYANEAVAMVDFGFRSSSITLLSSGELVLSRVVNIGGDRLTHGVAEALGTSYAEAENIKLGLAHEVQSTLVTLLTPLGRELRASIDFFEHQQDKTVTQVFMSGAAAVSENLLEILQAEITLPCVSWNPVGGLATALPKEQQDDLERIAPQLAVVTGAGLSAF